MPRLFNDLRRLNYLISEIENAYHNVAVQMGISDSVLKILYVIYNQENGERCPLQSIYVQTGISKQTINSALRRLEQDGFIYLERTNGKHKDVCLTQKGVSLAEHTAARLVEIENAIFAAWDKTEVEQYISLFEKYAKDFIKKATDLFEEVSL